MNPGNPFALLQQMMDPANAAHGDAVFSQEALDRVITQLMEQNQGSTAPGPAPDSAIKSLPKKKVEKEMLDDHGKAECSICMDSVKLGDQVTVLPCTHWFHEVCITAWLKEHDTCPHCRKGIAAPTDANTNTPRSTNSAPLPSRPSHPTSATTITTTAAVMPGPWQNSSHPGTTSRNPLIVQDSPPLRPPDLRTARQRYYSDQAAEDLERRDTHTHAHGHAHAERRRSSRSTPSSPHVRRHQGSSQREGSRSSSGGSGGGGRGGSGSGGFGGWVRSLGGGGSGTGGNSGSGRRD